MQGTIVEGTIGKLFEGRMHNFVECVNVDFKSTRQEVFADLQLLVRGCKNMYDSFDKYVEVEDLNGQNQYQAEGHGMQVRLPETHLQYYSFRSKRADNLWQETKPGNLLS